MRTHRTRPCNIYAQRKHITFILLRDHDSAAPPAPNVLTTKKVKAEVKEMSPCDGWTVAPIVSYNCPRFRFSRSACANDGKMTATTTIECSIHTHTAKKKEKEKAIQFRIFEFVNAVACHRHHSHRRRCLYFVPDADGRWRWVCLVCVCVCAKLNSNFGPLCMRVQVCVWA